MPRLTNVCPKYRHHRASGQAVVTIAGKDHYLGPWRSRASKREYDRLIGEWLSAGRPSQTLTPQSDLAVAEVRAAYWQFAKRYYVKNGEATGAQPGIKVALRFLRKSYGHTPAVEFGATALKSLQHRMVEAGQSRRYVNDNIDRIRRVFKWAASEELLQASIYHALRAVPNLRKGRTEARETDPVLPVEEVTVKATLCHLPAVVADMVQFQRLTGCRPNEVCNLRPCDVDMSEDVWAYRPGSHKTEHHGRERVIFIGPRAQAILRPYLLRDAMTYCFSPADSEKKRRRVAHESRSTPLSYGNRPGTNRKRRPSRPAGERYTSASYRRAIHRACDAAFPPSGQLAPREGESRKQWYDRLTPAQREQLKEWQSQQHWSPNQLRHAAATEIRREYGLEAAQVTLGHASADVSQIYAERDLAKARDIMRRVG